MKRILLLIAMMFAVLAAFVGAAWAYHTFPRYDTASGKSTAGKTVSSWAKPDEDALAYYGLGVFKTTLPVLYIDTGKAYVTKENPVWARIAVLDASEDGSPRSVTDTPDYSEAITIKYRGASSTSFDKRQYRIKFYKAQGSSKEKQCSLLGMGSNSEWVLNGPFLDKTLMRNHLIYTLGREILEWAPDNRYAEVFVDGIYQGVYLVVEPVTSGETRLRLSKFGLLSGDTAYIVSRDRIGSAGEPLRVYGKTAGKTNNDLYIDYPTEKDLTDSQRIWITADISRFEKALYSDDFSDRQGGYAQYIDMDSFADCYILNEVAMNHDMGNLSTYIYKELGGKLQMTLWDYNNCFDNYQWFAEDYTAFYGKDAAWFSRMLQDKNFVDRVMARYKELRKTTLSEEHILSVIGDTGTELGPAVERNFAVWGYTFDMNLLTGQGRDLTSYGDAVKQLRDAVHTRLDFLDEHFADLYEDCVTEEN
jgi:spore coat protein H